MNSIDYAVTSSENIVSALKQVAQQQYQHLLARTFANELTAEEQAYIKKANFYNIPLDSNNHCTITNEYVSDAVDEWEDKLRRAYALVDWTVGNYDPHGLEFAISEALEHEELEGDEYRRQVNAHYYSTRGC